MRVALVSDSMTAYGGAERVIEQIFCCFPEADLYCLADKVPAADRSFLGGRKVNVSFIHKIPGGLKHYQTLFPLWPLAIEQFDLSSYDLVLSNHHSVAWGALTHPGQTHVSYVHSPMRYAWDQQSEYLREADLERGPKSWLARWTLHRARLWDIAAARRPDLLIANSGFVASRVRRYHGLNSIIIHPPVAVETIAASKTDAHGDYYLSVGRLVPYKRAELLARAFAGMPDKRLKIIGTGPDEARIRKLGASNVELLGNISTDEVRTLMAAARAFIFAGVEDFGIAAVEAQAAGTPVLTFGAGGLAESVIASPKLRPTGMFFATQTVEAIQDAVARFEAAPRPLAADCIANARRFSESIFRTAYTEAVVGALTQKMPASSADCPAGTKWVHAA